MLFKTVHGSFLYGTAHEGSDRDYYVVVEPTGKRKYSKQSIKDGIDMMTVDLPTFLRFATMGVPQALEAMFAPNPIVDEIGYLRNSFVATGPEVRERYARTIKSFIYNDPTDKKKRHALRLAINLNDILKTGRFNPVMKKTDIKWATWCATVLNNDDCYEQALQTAYEGLFNGPISFKPIT